MFLVVFGLLVSIPIIVWGSQLVIKLMDRFPIIIVLGAMLLGWIAGGLLLGDPLLKTWVPADAPKWWSWLAGVVGAGLGLADRYRAAEAPAATATVGGGLRS